MFDNFSESIKKKRKQNLHAYHIATSDKINKHFLKTFFNLKEHIPHELLKLGVLIFHGLFLTCCKFYEEGYLEKNKGVCIVYLVRIL